MSGEPDDRDLIAGEYVLGALEPDEAREVERLAEADPALARAIEIWRERLAPLAAAVPPVAPPPFVWARIETTLGLTAAAETPSKVVPLKPKLAPPAKSPGMLGRVGFWRVTTAGALALAAAFAGLAWLGRPPAPDYAAALAPFNTPGPAFMVRWEPDGTMTVRPLTNVPVQVGKDLELWILPAGAKQPQSLGVLPAMGRQLVPPTANVPGAQLMVSLEPAGGSPTGLPSGPVLYAGTMTRLE